MAADAVTPFSLWRQSCDEHGEGTDAQRLRYIELCKEHGIIIDKEPDR